MPKTSESGYRKTSSNVCYLLILENIIFAHLMICIAVRIMVDAIIHMCDRISLERRGLREKVEERQGISPSSPLSVLGHSTLCLGLCTCYWDVLVCLLFYVHWPLEAFCVACHAAMVLISACTSQWALARMQLISWILFWSEPPFQRRCASLGAIASYLLFEANSVCSEKTVSLLPPPPPPHPSLMNCCMIP